ncbi:MAG: DUF1552 domain-containing protein [Polyangiaceae bacterium]|nr:DUF1552 domain-containing protein [Polyangiaceae bacterium]
MKGRRAFLRGAAGATLALPLLELTHGSAWSAVEPARRLIVMFSHGGTISCRDREGNKENGQDAHHGWDLWAPPSESTTLTAMGEEMSPLDSLVGDLILLRGVDNMAGTAEYYGGNHGWANVTAMTGADVEDHDDYQLPMGPSVDQVLAARLSEQAPTVFPSIDLEVNGHNYGTPFFRAAGEAISSERNPVLAYQQIFGDVQPSEGPDPELLRIRAMKRSVLDGVLGGFNDFKNRVGKTDALTLEAHADHIRGMEKQLDALENVAECTLPGTEGAVDDEWYGPEAEQVAPLMVDYIIHAMRCGLSNVATLAIGDLLTTWLPSPYETDLGHSLHHAAREVGPLGTEYGVVNEWRETIVNNRQWRAQMFARLIEGLKATPEGAGNMLDYSVVMFTSEFSAGAVHSVRDVPMLLAGRAGNRWTTGRHYNYNKAVASNPGSLDYNTDASNHNVFTSILNAFGFDDEHFGNSMSYRTGPLAELG